MRAWFQKKLEEWVGLLLGWLWKKEKPKVDALIQSNAAIQIPGLATPIPLSHFAAFEPAIAIIINDLKDGHDAHHILANVKKNVVPEAIATAEAVLGIFFPAGATLLALIVWLVEHRSGIEDAMKHNETATIPAYDGHGNLVMIPNPDVRNIKS